MKPFHTSRSPVSAGDHRRSGFTLIELLVVIMIIAILSGIVLTAIGGSDNSRTLQAGVTRLDSMFTLARSVAITQKVPTRVLISVDPSSMADPEKPQSMLRQVLVVYLDEDTGWEVYEEGYLPQGIYFSPALSSSSTKKLMMWEIPFNQSNYEFGAPATPAPVETSTAYGLAGAKDPLSHGPKKDLWYAFDFASNGNFTRPGTRVVLVNGLLLPESGNNYSITIQAEPGTDPTEQAAGFVVFKSGKILRFRSGAHIKEGL